MDRWCIIKPVKINLLGFRTCQTNRGEKIWYIFFFFFMFLCINIFSYISRKIYFPFADDVYTLCTFLTFVYSVVVVVVVIVIRVLLTFIRFMGRGEMVNNQRTLFTVNLSKICTKKRWWEWVGNGIYIYIYIWRHLQTFKFACAEYCSKYESNFNIFF